MVEGLISERLRGLILAFTTTPSTEIWLCCFGIFLLLIVIITPIGLRSGFLRIERMVGSRWRLVVVALMLAIRPALLEEFLFRALLLPHPAQGYPLRLTLLWAVVGLVIFTLWHPINGLFIRKIARSLFTDPLFLTFAGLLGIACTAAYLISGSIWPPMLIHWAVVTPWILFFGGGNTLYSRADS
ncbi:MAG TPA: CPBP family intramembrane metalloprotease [Anaerolineae bacterium]|nr:CPBP family intramembrane metalloprotease [Anaerolineae bacterium]